MKISLENLLQSTEAGWVMVYDMLKTLQQQIEAFTGALIFIGTIDLDASNVTQAALDARAQELGKYPLSKGYVLVDNNSSDWWYNGAEWVNIGYYDVARATNSSLGVVKGSTDNMKVSVDLAGEMSVNGLDSTLNAKQNALTAGANININGGVISAAGLNKKLNNTWGWPGTGIGNWKLLLGGASSTSWSAGARIQLWRQSAEWFDIQLLFNRANRRIYGIASNSTVVNDYLAFQDTGSQFNIYYKHLANADISIKVSDSSGFATIVNDTDNLTPDIAPITSGLFTPTNYAIKLGSNTQLVRGDGSLMYRVQPSPIINGTGTASTKVALIRWNPPSFSSSALTIDSRQYLEGEVVDVYVYGMNSLCQINGINDSGVSVKLFSGLYAPSCTTKRMVRFVKGSNNLEYICTWDMLDGIYS